MTMLSIEAAIFSMLSQPFGHSRSVRRISLLKMLDLGALII